MPPRTDRIFRNTVASTSGDRKNPKQAQNVFQTIAIWKKKRERKKRFVGRGLREEIRRE